MITMNNCKSLDCHEMSWDKLPTGAGFLMRYRGTGFLGALASWLGTRYFPPKKWLVPKRKMTNIWGPQGLTFWPTVWGCMGVSKNGANHHDGLSVGRGLTALLHLHLHSINHHLPSLQWIVVTVVHGSSWTQDVISLNLRDLSAKVV